MELERGVLAEDWAATADAAMAVEVEMGQGTRVTTEVEMAGRLN